MDEKQAISRIEGLIDPYPCGANLSSRTVEALEMAVRALKEQAAEAPAEKLSGRHAGERCPVGGIDRSGEVDRIDIETVVETPFWLAVWATEPERKVDVRMSYSDLKTLIDCFDNVRRFLGKEGRDAEA